MQNLTTAFLTKKKVPKILWKGLIAAALLGWTGWLGLTKINNYYELKALFPTTAQVSQVLDGDTFQTKQGLDFRLLGLNAPDRGEPNYDNSTNYLKNLIENKKITIEYDTYQDDKYGRNLAYIFLPCQPELSNILSKYCRGNHVLVNEILIKEGYAQAVIYKDRRPLKYADFLNIN